MAAKKAGATGVTITGAHGMGLKEMTNFYNRLHSPNTDVQLVFITQSNKVAKIVQRITIVTIAIIILVL